MKIKYLRLTKDEKKNAKEKFLQTEAGKYVKKKLTSVMWSGWLCMGFAIYIIVDAYIKKLNLFDYIYGSIIFVFGIVFVILAHRTYITKINDFITKK